MPALDPALIALLGTLCGGIGLKVTEHWLGRAKERAIDTAALRAELRAEIAAQKTEIRLLEAEVEEWRNKYYDLRDTHFKMQTELTLAIQAVKKEVVASYGNN